MTQDIVSVRTYLVVYAALLLLVLATALAHFQSLGPFNFVVALGIAIVKAALVILYFMHVRYSSKLTWVIVIGAMFWLGIMFSLTYGDYLSRGWVMWK